LDVVFFTHALVETGFGHAMRCARLAGLLKKMRPSTSVAFAGEFDQRAMTLLQSIAPLEAVSAEPLPAAVGIYDRMDDTEEPSAFDQGKLALLTQRCKSVIFFANGLQQPQVGGNVTVIGYKPGDVHSHPPRLFWDLRYAPVAIDAPGDTVPRDRSRAFVALGGARGMEGLRKVLTAIARLPSIVSVDVLGSPLNPVAGSIGECVRPDQDLRVHQNVEDLSAFLRTAGLVIASYGHLGYEALAYGAPLCLVGQKQFQAQYAERLAASGLCVAAGLLAHTTASMLADKFGQTLRSADALSKSAREAIDGHGLARIAELILACLEAA